MARSPLLGHQIVHILEMAIPGDESQPVLSSRGRDPDVVLRDRPPFSQESDSDAAIVPRRLVIAYEYRKHAPQVLETLKVLFDSARFLGTKEELAQNGGIQETLSTTAALEIDLLFKDRDRDVGV